MAGQRRLDFDVGLVGAELQDPEAVRALAGAIAAGRADDAHELARELLERSA